MTSLPRQSGPRANPVALGQRWLALGSSLVPSLEWEVSQVPSRARILLSHVPRRRGHSSQLQA